MPNSLPLIENTHFVNMLALAQRERIPVISTRNAAFLRALLLQRRPMHMLEIGSAIGVSTALIADTLSAWGGQLISTEISIPTHAIAQINMAALGLGNVQCFCGDARDWLIRWAEEGKPTFDCIFIDAHKNQTHSFYEVCLPMLSPNALIIVDDAWLFRAKMRDFYAMLTKKMQAYSLHFVDGADATLVIKIA